ncbi:MAG: phosphoadenylyl-sulfate reductase [Candidatus Omnitrophica bacterium]|nr:phosphoadenylyl-sulfate reductase [Candidatus Omnitrophota bacterium]
MAPLDLNQINQDFSGKQPQEIIGWALKEFGPKLVLASSFGPEDVAMIHMAAQIDKKIRIITLDTGRLNEETYLVADTVLMEYGVKIETYFPDAAAVEALVSKKGNYSFRESVENRKECCRIRKVEPLKRALAGADAWITGQRKSQSITRQSLEYVEIDQAFNGIYKINPLRDWTEQDVWNYIKANHVPYNKLFDRGYRSIGCAPCTRPVESGQDERAGRWWWENPEHKECGIHQTNESRA